jgi:hypothetical protein
MPTSSTVISRAQLDHPDLDHDGGSSLHTKIATLLTRVGDFLDSRFFYQNALANSASVDFEHNFKTALTDITAILYLRDTGTGELTRITPTSTPAITAFTIAATPSFLTTKIRVTNNSGSARDIALVVRHSPPMLDDIYDVDLSTPPTTGQVLSYDGTSKTWKPASGANLATNALSGLIAAIDFESFTAVKTSNYSALVGDKVLTNTTGGSFTVTLPSGSIGNKVEVLDYAGTWGTNPLTVSPGGNNLNGVAGSRTFTMPWSRVRFVFTTSGWLVDQEYYPKNLTSIKTANYTAIPGDRVKTDSSGGAFTVTLPGSPSINDEVDVIDVSGSWASFNVTLARNGSNINGSASDLPLNVSGDRITATYINSTYGWRIS